MELQKTFGSVVGFKSVVAVADLPTDLVECIDTGNTVPRRDATFHQNGDAYEDSSELGGCENCCENVDCAELEENSGWCEECDDTLRIVCNDCNTHVLSEDSYGIRGGNTICEGCRDNYYSFCDDCDEYVNSDDITVVGDCHYVCDHCLRDKYTRCDRCGEYAEDSDITNAADGNSLCESCRDEHYAYCDECDNWVHCHNMNGDDVCEDCAEEEGEKGRCGNGNDYSIGSDLRSNRTYGVELEVSQLPNCSETDHKIGLAGWRAGTDCSVHCAGREYTSPILRGDDGLRSIRKIMGHLKGASCDDSCGVHLHMGMGDVDHNARKSIALAYHYTCDVWHAFVDRQRDGTNYSRRHNRYYDRRRIMATTDVRSLCRERYIWVNWHAISNHGTVEIRVHHGTCDGYEVQSWVKAHLRFVDFVSKLSVAQVTRVFGGKNRFVLFAELSRIWDDPELSVYYANKAKASDRPVRKVDAA